MKRTIIGGFISLIGTIGVIALSIAAAVNPTSGWTTPPGRFLTTVSELGILPLFIISIVFVILGIGILAVEFFKKE